MWPGNRDSTAILWGWISRNPTENGESVAGPREVGALLNEYRIPVRSPGPHSHFVYEHTEDSIERNVSGRQVRAADLSTSDLCSLLQMQMGSFDRTVAAGMPVIQQDFSLLGIVDHVVVSYDINSPRSTYLFGLDNAIVLLQPEHEL